MFSLICAWTNGGVNNRDADDLRRHRAHYNVTVVNTEFHWRAHAINYYLKLHHRLNHRIYMYVFLDRKLYIQQSINSNGYIYIEGSFVVQFSTILIPISPVSKHPLFCLGFQSVWLKAVMISFQLLRRYKWYDIECKKLSISVFMGVMGHLITNALYTFVKIDRNDIETVTGSQNGNILNRRQWRVDDLTHFDSFFCRVQYVLTLWGSNRQHGA